MNFFQRLFGKKQEKVALVTPVKVDGSSQPYVLQNNMMMKQMTHDQTVLADIPNVRVRDEGGEPKMYFCGINGLIIKEQISKGDGKYLPEGVVLEDLKIMKNFKSGYYNLKNVKLHSNGSIQVIATADTEWELVERS
jgi:hypothetical protein